MRQTYLAAVAVAAVAAAGAAQADKLDDIIASGVLRCAVVLDFPPMGSRDADNNPVGFDVDYCNDLAAALGVTAGIRRDPVPRPHPGAGLGPRRRRRRLDLRHAGARQDHRLLDPLLRLHQRRADPRGRRHRGLRGHGGQDRRLGRRHLRGASSSRTTSRNGARASSAPTRARPTCSWRCRQGQIDATVVTSTVASAIIATGQYPGLTIAGDAPYPIDYVGLIALREEYGLINYLNLFVNQQVRSGRYQELYDKWVGGAAPELTISGVYR